MHDICLEATLKFLLCLLHGYGVHRTQEDTRRHLQSEDPHCHGEMSRQAGPSLAKLPLSSLEDMRMSNLLLMGSPSSRHFLTSVSYTAGTACLAQVTS